MEEGEENLRMAVCVWGGGGRGGVGGGEEGWEVRVLLRATQTQLSIPHTHTSHLHCLKQTSEQSEEKPETGINMETRRD